MWCRGHPSSNATFVFGDARSQSTPSLATQFRLFGGSVVFIFGGRSSRTGAGMSFFVPTAFSSRSPFLHQPTDGAVLTPDRTLFRVISSANLMLLPDPTRAWSGTACLLPTFGVYVCFCLYAVAVVWRPTSLVSCDKLLLPDPTPVVNNRVSRALSCLGCASMFPPILLSCSGGVGRRAGGG